MTLRLAIHTPIGVWAARSGLVTALLVILAVSGAEAQPWSDVAIGGYATYGRINFTADESFETITGRSFGSLVGGGARVGLPWFNIFVDVGAWKFDADGERVLRLDGRTYKLGIPVAIVVIPLELTIGYQFRQFHRLTPRVTPYAGAGLSSFKYEETSTFAGAGEDVSLRSDGYHVMGGAEVKVIKWLGVAGEVAWTSIDKAIGTAGISKEFGDTDLGGTTFRVKITIGRD